MNQELREMVFALTNGFCEKCTESGTEVHHKLSRSKLNLRLYPLFIDSIFNLQILCYQHHHNEPLDKIRPEQAVVYENWLKLFLDNNLPIGYDKGKKGGLDEMQKNEKSDAARKLGSIKTAKKAISSRKNGKLGGRPKKKINNNKI